MTPPPLRPYQLECLNVLKARYKAGKRRLLVSLPTGTGKTVVFASFPSFFNMQRKMLVLAHREELLDQACRKLAERSPGFSVGVEQGQRRTPDDTRVVLASVPTLGRRGSERIKRFARDEFLLIIVDEAHHAVAKSYRTVLEHFGAFAPGSKTLVVGFTATPRRGDGRGLGEVFEEVAYGKGLEEMIVAGFLAGVSGWRVRTEVGLDDVRVTKGDFDEADLAEAVNTPARNDLVVKAYQQKAAGRRCVIFCADVAHAQAVAERFRAAQIRAECVWGDMSKTERQATLDSFSGGRLDVLTNCNVLTEGYDEPRVDCVLMARPTKSLLLYAQMVGRGTRLHPEKTNLVVIDIVDNSTKHSLANLNMLFELPDGIDLKGRDPVGSARLLRAIQRDHPYIDVDRVTDAGDLDAVMERIDLFRCEPPHEIAAISELTWLRLPGGGYRLALDGAVQLCVQSDLLGRWQVRRLDPASLVTDNVVAEEQNLERAIRAADSLVRREHADSMKLVHRDASWRDRSPTEKQLKMLRRWQLPTPDGLTRGQAGWIIAHYIAARSSGRRPTAP